MIVVADTSPINYLVLIGEVDVLAQLYHHITIPPQVLEELSRSQAPAVVRTWIESPPAWLQVRSPLERRMVWTINLDRGESAAIQLAEELGADRIVLDELLGRQEARRRGLEVIGTLGVLREASQLGLLNLANAIEKLKQTSFHLSPKVLQAIMRDP